MEEQTFVRWLELPEEQPVRFGDLPGLMAGALHDSEFAQVGAEINFTAALKKMVDAGELMVRDPLTFGRHTFPIGEALRRAVLLPREDLRPLLAAHSIGLRLIPKGTGPTHWTIENSAGAIAAQEGWHQGARDTLRGQMVQAVADGTLTVRHPHTGLAYRPEIVRDFYDLVTPADVNSWLARDPELELRWRQSPSEPVPAVVEPAPVSKETTPPPLTTPDIADAFDGIDGQTAKQWRDKLGDVNNHQWLVEARAQTAKAPKPATWWPIKFAELLLAREASAESLNRAFMTEPKLKPWLPLWQEKRRERNAFGQ